MKLKRTAAPKQLGCQLNSFSIVSISSSSDSLYMMNGMVREEPWKLLNVLRRAKTHFSKIIIKNRDYENETVKFDVFFISYFCE